MGRPRRYYVAIFFAHNGLGPHICCLCNKEIALPWTMTPRKLQMYVHHKDENRENCAPENLEALHGGYHSSSHASRQRGPRGKRIQLSFWPWLHGVKLRQKNTGVKLSNAHRKAIKDGLKKYYADAQG